MEYADPAMELNIPERARLAEILCFQQPNLTDEEIIQQRVEAMDLMVALGDKRDG